MSLGGHPKPHASLGLSLVSKKCVLTRTVAAEPRFSVFPTRSTLVILSTVSICDDTKSIGRKAFRRNGICT